MAGDARRLDDAGRTGGLRHARPRHGLVPRGTRRQITFTRDITICPQAKQILDGDVPSATLTDIVEPWFLGGGADGPGGAEFAAFKAEHEGKVRFHASISDMPKPDGNMMAMVCTRRPAVLRRLHAIDARRLQERRSWVVCFPILSEFGPNRDASRRETHEALAQGRAGAPAQLFERWPLRVGRGGRGHLHDDGAESVREMNLNFASTASARRISTVRESTAVSRPRDTRRSTGSSRESSRRFRFLPCRTSTTRSS